MQGLPLVKEIEMLKETVQRKIRKTSNLIQSHHFLCPYANLSETSHDVLNRHGHIPGWTEHIPKLNFI